MIAKWKIAWAWIKKNWKLLLGAAIPILIGVILRRGNAKQIWKQVAESKEKELKLKENVNQVGDAMKDQAWKDLKEDEANLNEFQRRRLAQIEAERKERLKEIDTAEKATEAIKDKLEE